MSLLILLLVSQLLLFLFSILSDLVLLGLALQQDAVIDKYSLWFDNQNNAVFYLSQVGRYRSKVYNKRFVIFFQLIQLHEAGILQLWCHSIQCIKPVILLCLFFPFFQIFCDSPAKKLNPHSFYRQVLHLYKTMLW